MTRTIEARQPETPEARAFLNTPRKKLLIGGEWRDPQGGNGFETTDPASGAKLADIAEASEADVDSAVQAARAALADPAWREMKPNQRGRLLWRVADLIEAHADELAELEILDQGKSWSTARFAEIPASAEQFRYYAGFANKILGQTIPTSIGYHPPGKKLLAYTTREPVGVVAAITPWNSPLLMAAMKLAPALCAGCAVILKPAEETSLTALRLGELLVEAGLPPGTVNVVTGQGATVGAFLTGHSGVDKVAFTGSTEVGRAIVAAAGGNLKKLTLELGGKSPAIVMADADLALAIPGVARGIFANSGQVCVAGSRVYVHRDIRDAFVEGLVDEARRLKLGHGLDRETELGPLISEKQAERVAGYVEGGRADGASILTGGQRLGPNGQFFAPTVMADVTADMPLMRDEIFGPVAAVMSFEAPDEAVAYANDTTYGLAASVWTRDLSTAHRLASEIRAGTVWINCHSYFSPELPKGGHRESGWGYENGPQGLENYLETKTVCAMI